MLGKLKAMVWEDTSTDKKPEAAPQATRPVASFTPNIEMPVVDAVLDVAGIAAAIQANIEAAPEFADFVKFNTQSVALEKVIPIEATRYQASQATTGLTKEQLLTSVSSFQTVLAAEAQNFADNYVVASEQNILAINDHAASIANEIQALTQKLAELSNQKEELTRDAMTKTAELAKAKIDHDSVIKSITQRYTEISTKIQQYLAA